MQNATLRQQLRAAEARAVQWQPIETAPRDGTVILVTGLNFGTGPGRYYVEVEFVNGFFYYANDPVSDELAELYLTHWMPLPKPPEQAQAPQGSESE